MGLFEDARRSVNFKGRVGDIQNLGWAADRAKIKAEQLGLLHEFIAGMKHLGVKPEKHEVTYYPGNGYPGGKSYRPKRYVVGYKVGPYVITPGAQVFPLRHTSKNDPKSKLPVEFPIIDSWAYDEASPEHLTGNGFHESLARALGDAMKS